MEGDAVLTPAPRADELVRVIALDGPAGSGKSTVARRTAVALGWRFVDTGATYRAAALAVLRAGVDLTDPAAVAAAVAGASIELSTDPDRPAVRLDGEDVSREVRSAEVTAAVSAVSAVPAVRLLLIDTQRRAMGVAGAVVEGRDIATVVAPRAAVKVYLDARPEVRAARRARETGSPQPSARAVSQANAGKLAAHAADQAADGKADAAADLVALEATVAAALERRDRLDNQTNRLQASDGAVHLDTSDVTLDQVVAAIVDLARDAGLTAPTARDAGLTAPTPAAQRARVDVTWRRATGTRKTWLVAISRPFGWLLFHAVFRIRVRGAEHVPRHGAVLLAGNHTGFLDGPLVYALSPRSATFLAKSELFVGPLARALGWLGQIPVHRGRPDRTALRSGLEVLRGGGALGVFPEGTRGAGTLDEVSDGLAYLALRSGAPVVPLAVLGTAEAMPKGSRLPRWRSPVTLVFGPAVTVTVDGDPRARRTVRAAAEQLRLALVDHLHAATADAPPPRAPRSAQRTTEPHERKA